MLRHKQDKRDPLSKINDNSDIIVLAGIPQANYVR